MSLSSRTLNDYESEALALKFDSGRDKYSFEDNVKDITDGNMWTSKRDKYKFFFLTCYKVLSNKQPDSLPRRYSKALRDLVSDSDIIVTQAVDKGDGIVIMDRAQFAQKMQDVLNDEDTREKCLVLMTKQIKHPTKKQGSPKAVRTW